MDKHSKWRIFAISSYLKQTYTYLSLLWQHESLRNQGICLVSKFFFQTFFFHLQKLSYILYLQNLSNKESKFWALCQAASKCFIEKKNFSINFLGHGVQIHSGLEFLWLLYWSETYHTIGKLLVFMLLRQLPNRPITQSLATYSAVNLPCIKKIALKNLPHADWNNAQNLFNPLDQICFQWPKRGFLGTIEGLNSEVDRIISSQNVDSSFYERWNQL